MYNKIEDLKVIITEEIIKTDIENKKNKKEDYLKITKIDYLKRLLKLLKLVESE
jgi:hypothetical protein